MFEILEQGEGRVVGLKVTGKITAADMTAMTRRLEAEIAGTQGPIRLLSDVSDFDGMEVAAFWQDLTFSLKHLGDFDRVAVVGTKTWIEWWTKGLSPFIKAEARCFPPEAIDQAWAWLREGA
jgi:hypothetical protein